MYWNIKLPKGRVTGIAAITKNKKIKKYFNAMK
jgi:hypothetical protein